MLSSLTTYIPSHKRIDHFFSLSSSRFEWVFFFYYRTTYKPSCSATGFTVL